METFLLILKIVLYVIGFLSIILTALPFLKLFNWWVRIGDFPRIQIACGALITAVLMLVFVYPYEMSEIIFVSILFLCVIYQLYRILPYTPLYPIQVEQELEDEPHESIQILICNVFEENKDTDKLKNLDQVSQARSFSARRSK